MIDSRVNSYKCSTSHQIVKGSGVPDVEVPRGTISEVEKRVRVLEKSGRLQPAIGYFTARRNHKNGRKA